MRSTATFVFLVVALAGALPAHADVIPQRTLFSVLDGSRRLSRVRNLPPLNGWRAYAVRDASAVGYVAPEYDDYGYLASGADVLIVPLQSGGSGGVFATLLFTGIRTHPRFVGYVPSGAGHLGVSIAEGKIKVSTPNYGPSDPNCCPSSLTYTLYALKGVRLEKLDEYTLKLRAP